MLYLFLFCLIAPLITAQQSQQLLNESGEEQFEPESPEASYLGLPSGASRTVPNIRVSFSCVGRRYGYFADIENNCQLFHICNPSVAPNGEPVVYQYTNFCPANTRFDQQALSCLPLNSPTLLPCSESLRFYPTTEARFAEPAPVQREVPRFAEVAPVQREIVAPVQREVPRFAEVAPVQREVPRFAEPAPIQREINNVVPNENIQRPNLIRNEPLPQALPERSDDFEETIPQRAPEQSVVSQPIVRNVESIPQYLLSAPGLNRQVVGQSAPVVFRNTPSQQIVNRPVVAPVQFRQPVVLQSDINLRRTVPQIQSQLYRYEPLLQPYVPLSETARVVRPAQNVSPLARSEIQIPTQVLPQQQFAAPQQFRVTEQNVVRPAQNLKTGQQF